MCTALLIGWRTRSHVHVELMDLPMSGLFRPRATTGSPENGRISILALAFCHDCLSHTQPDINWSRMNRPVTFFFTHKSLALVGTLESLLTLTGAAVTMWVIFGAANIDVLLCAVLTSMAMGLSGSGAYYLRRLYRAAFDDRIQIVGRGEHRAERFGTILYLLGRPVISIALTLAAALGTILAYTSVAPEGVVPTRDLIYLTGSLGFVTGFLSGRAITHLETKGTL